MARLTFSGGIHPYDGKDLSKDKPIREVLPKGGFGVSAFAAYRSTGETHCK